MKKHLISIITLLVIAFQSYAQSFKEHRGDIFFNKFNYLKAASLYKVALERDSVNSNLMRKLAISYKMFGKDSVSAIWYSKLIESGNADSTDLSNYYIVLKNKGDFDKAYEVIKKTLQQNDGKYLLSKELAENLKSKAFRYNISLINESTEYAEFSPAYFGNKIIFASSRQGAGITNRKYIRDGQPFLQLFVADIAENGQLSGIKEFAANINTRYHEGPVSYCIADSTMYFTRNNFNQYKKLSSDGKLNLKVFTAQFAYNEWLKSIENKADSLIGMKAKLTDKDWRNIKEFKYNNNEYSTGHPTLTPDGKKMYLVSDMPGGIGGTDIYLCERMDNNEWSKPINLAELNTKGNEMFPFIHPSGVLFFASDGIAGLGGLDIFKANPKGNGFDKPENMGAPLNTSFDDFGLIADTEMKTGYFSSNRANGKGSDDIYFVEFTNIRYITLALRVIDKETNSTITNANVELTNNTLGESKPLSSDSYGFYSTIVKLTENFNATVQFDDYIPYSSSIAMNENGIVNDSLIITVPLVKKNFYGVFGNVYIKDTKEFVPEVMLTFQPDNNEKPITITSSENGEFRTLLSEKTTYDVTITKQDFFTIKDKYSTIDKNPGWVNLNEYIDLNIEKIDLNKTIELPNIYYDLGKWNIRKDAAIELNKVVALLNDNPNIKIELGSHTDSRGNAESNQSLSQKRAQSAVDYIISKGISKDRIVAKGYGESKLKNQCSDGIKCDEKEHQQNRRTEIRVLSF